MKRICAECRTTDVVTGCDKCNTMTCRNCAYHMIVKNQLNILHRACLPRNHPAKTDTKVKVNATIENTN